MPWCEECARFLTPTSMGRCGECPTCGRVLAGAGVTDEPADEAADKAADEDADPPEVPWHFKLLVLATILYLAFRAVQGVAWLAGHL